MANNNIVRIGNNFNPDLVGLQITDPKSLSTLTFANFNINSNVTKRTKINYDSFFGNITKKINTDVSFYKGKINFKNDYSFPLNYINYGSTSEFFRSSIEKIIANYPYSLYINPFNTGLIEKFTVISYTYDPITNTSEFYLPANTINNKFDLIYSQDFINEQKGKLSNIIENYKDYTVYLPIQDKEFNIIEFTPSTTINTGNIYIKARGEVFSGVTYGNYSFYYHIKPSIKRINSHKKEFFNDFENYLLSNYRQNKYFINIKRFVDLEDGTRIINDTELRWNTSDGWNVDMDSQEFNSFVSDILDIGLEYDQIQTDLIYRHLIPESLRLYDYTDKSSMQKLLRIYGKSFDEIQNVIRNFSYLSTITYDKINNTSDKLIFYLAKYLALDPYNFVDEQLLFEKFDTLGGIVDEINQIPSQINIELWRRLLINIQYLFKSKGTRKSLEFIFRLFGIDESLYVIHEFVHKLDYPLNNININLDNINIEGLTELPFDKEGYPKAIKENTRLYFHVTDYFDAYSRLGLDITLQVDNKKTKVRDNDYRKTMNNKYLFIGIDPIRHIEYDVYLMNKFPVCCLTNALFEPYIYDEGDEVNIPEYSGNTIAYERFYPVLPNRLYPNRENYPNYDLNYFKVTGYTFVEYLESLYTYFINARNRKTLSDNHGSGYPALKEIYYDYLRNYKEFTCLSSPEYTLDEMYEYMDRIDLSIFRLLKKFIPATARWFGLGLVLRNSIFTQQKFVYKRGINEGSEFVTDICYVTSPTNLRITEQTDNSIKLEWDDSNIFNDSYNVYYEELFRGCDATPPNNIQITATTASSVDFIWEDENSFNESYTIERSTNNIDFTEIENNITDKFYKDENLDDTLTYYYRIKSFQTGCGLSAPSDVLELGLCTTTPVDLTTITQVSTTSIQLVWVDENISNEFYKIERKTMDGDTIIQDFVIVANNVLINSYTDNGLNPFYSYVYRIISSQVGCVDSIPSNEIEINMCNPNTPIDLVLLDTDNVSFIEIGWSDITPTDNDSYIIERSVNNTNNFTTIGIDVNRLFIFRDDTIDPINTYYYRVRGREINACPTPSAPSSILEVRLCNPQPVTLNNPVIINNNSVRLTWVEPIVAHNNSGYRIERSIDNFVSNNVPVTTINNNAVFVYDDVNLPNNTYQYRIVSLQTGCDESLPSNIAEIDVCYVLAPTGLIIETTGYFSVTLRWNHVNTNTSYTVQYSTDTSFNNVVSVDSPNSSEIYVYNQVVDLNENTLYNFRIIANQSCGASIPSTPVSTTTLNELRTDFINGVQGAAGGPTYIRFNYLIKTNEFEVIKYNVTLNKTGTNIREIEVLPADGSSKFLPSIADMNIGGGNNMPYNVLNAYGSPNDYRYFRWTVVDGNGRELVIESMVEDTVANYFRIDPIDFVVDGTALNFKTRIRWYTSTPPSVRRTIAENAAKIINIYKVDINGVETFNGSFTHNINAISDTFVTDGTTEYIDRSHTFNPTVGGLYKLVCSVSTSGVERSKNVTYIKIS